MLKIRAKFLMRCKLTDHVAISSFDTISLIEITWDLAKKNCVVTKSLLVCDKTWLKSSTFYKHFDL